MNEMLSARLLVLLSMVYGLMVVLLAVFDGPAGPFAIVGAMVIGLLWAVRGMIHSRRR